MATSEEIRAYLEMLATHRSNLREYLKQWAQFTGPYAPPPLINGIKNERREIKRVKAILRAWGIAIDDGLYDEEEQPMSPYSPSQPSPPTPGLTPTAAKPFLQLDFLEGILSGAAIAELLRSTGAMEKIGQGLRRGDGQ